MPADWVPSPRALRLWAIAAGRREEDRYLLGLDPHAPETHSPLATALMRAGIAPTLVGTRGLFAGPADRRPPSVVASAGEHRRTARAPRCRRILAHGVTHSFVRSITPLSCLFSHIAAP